MMGQLQKSDEMSLPFTTHNTRLKISSAKSLKKRFVLTLKLIITDLELS